MSSRRKSTRKRGRNGNTNERIKIASKRRRTEDKENINPNIKSGAYDDDEMYDLIEKALESGWYTCGDVRNNVDNICKNLKTKRHSTSVKRKFRNMLYLRNDIFKLLCLYLDYKILINLYQKFEQHWHQKQIKKSMVNIKQTSYVQDYIVNLK